ncbi:MAG: DUF1016 N-terminal domain-containing protein [Planctomycetota bacterium]|nr:DUF1016 N-terminal domain-containing protein [Planctomycetota bacterium]
MKNKGKSTELQPFSMPKGLIKDLRKMIEKTRVQVATAINVGLVSLNWHLGQRLWKEIMGEQHATYGDQIIDAVSRQLTTEYGRGFSKTKSKVCFMNAQLLAKNRRSLFKMNSIYFVKKIF